MTFSSLGLSSLTLEFLCLFLMLGTFIIDLLNIKNKEDVVEKVTLGGLALLFTLSLLTINHRGIAFNGMFQLDAFAAMFKSLFLLISLFITVLSKESLKNFQNRSEFYLLILAITLGMLLVASANDFLILFISVELVTISFYVLTAYLKTDEKSVEAGMKYLILGSLSTGFMLYGISYIYGNIGNTNFALMRDAILAQNVPASLMFGTLLVLAGIGFKIGIFPFHSWVPDVYEGAPAPVTAFLASGSKIVGFCALTRLFLTVIQPLNINWSYVLAALSALTILYGNLGALPQKNIKRLMAFSGITHAGYILMGIASGTVLGSQATVFYLVTYALAVLGAFLVIVFWSAQTGSDDLDSYNGLSEKSPLLAAGLFVALLSLAGVPPLAGFFAKMTILLSAIQGGLIWLAFIGIINVVISLYYYLNIIKRLYFYKASDAQKIAVPATVSYAIYITIAATIFFGIFQEPLVEMAQAAVAGIIN